MLTIDVVLAIVSVVLFATGCALFLGSRLVSRHPELRERNIRLDFSPQVGALLVTAVVSGVLSQTWQADSLNINSLPATAAGISSLGEATEMSSAERDGEPGLLSWLPPEGRFSLQGESGTALADMELISDGLNTYQMVLEVNPSVEQGTHSEVFTGSLLRRNGEWVMAADSGRWPAWFPGNGNLLQLSMADEGFLLTFSRDGNDVRQYWSEN